MQIIIPHKNQKLYYKVSIANTPYHVWEHLYIRIIYNIFYNCEILVSGMCLNNYTIIDIDLIKEDMRYDGGLIIERLENCFINKKWIKIEYLLIRNELPCMERVYGIKYIGNLDYVILNHMMKFRKQNYDWGNVDIHMEQKIHREHYINKQDDNDEEISGFHENKIDDIRNRLLNKFYNKVNTYSCTRNIDFVLFCCPIEKANEDIKNKIFKYLEISDKLSGFYQKKFKSKYPITIISWPSLETRENKLWLTIFTYLKYDYYKFFIYINLDRIRRWFKNNYNVDLLISNNAEIYNS